MDNKGELDFSNCISNEFDCKQGAVRAVRFNGKLFKYYYYSNIILNI